MYTYTRKITPQTRVADERFRTDAPSTEIQAPGVASGAPTNNPSLRTTLTIIEANERHAQPWRECVVPTLLLEGILEIANVNRCARLFARRLANGEMGLCPHQAAACLSPPTRFLESSAWLRPIEAAACSPLNDNSARRTRLAVVGSEIASRLPFVAGSPVFLIRLSFSSFVSYRAYVRSPSLVLLISDTDRENAPV